MKDKPFLGVADDPRSDIQKAQDFPHEEFAAAAPAPLEWVGKPKESWRRFPKRDQASSSSCMAHSGVKMLGVENVLEDNEFVELSARPVYRARANFPGEGMWQQDLLALLSKPTACLEEQVPSMGMLEADLNKPYTPTRDERASAEFYRAGGYFFLGNDIVEIAKIIDKGKAVHLLLFFLEGEYWKTVPAVIEPDLRNDRADTRILRHGITAVDRTLWGGERALVIEDSAGLNTTFDGNGQRIITESFLKARCYGAGYLAYRQNAAEAIPKPQHTFNRELWYGIMRDAEVAWLQKALQYEGFLATSIDKEPLPLGNFLQMTGAALKKWQVKHGIMDFALEPDVRKVRFGPKSIRLANSLYA